MSDSEMRWRPQPAPGECWANLVWPVNRLICALPATTDLGLCADCHQRLAGNYTGVTLAPEVSGRLSLVIGFSEGRT